MSLNQAVGPLVSVIMPVRDTAAYLPAAIDSVLSQTMTCWELLVIDDRSIDGSRQIARAYAAADERIVAIDSDRPPGAAHARNAGIVRARGRYIAFLDSDDLWLPGKLASQLAHAEENPAAIHYTDYCKIDAGDRVDPATFTPSTRIVRAPRLLTYRHMLRQDYIGFLTCMYDRDIVGTRYLPEIERRQDYAMLLEILRDGHLAHGLPEPLAIYRARRSGSLSSNKFVAAGYNWRIYREHERLALPRAAMAFGNYAVRAGAKYLV